MPPLGSLYSSLPSKSASRISSEGQPSISHPGGGKRKHATKKRASGHTPPGSSKSAVAIESHQVTTRIPVRSAPVKFRMGSHRFTSWRVENSAKNTQPRGRASPGFIKTSRSISDETTHRRTIWTIIRDHPGAVSSEGKGGSSRRRPSTSSTDIHQKVT